ncbi:hypothetical protein [Myceligenerans xiligouense]|uniref:Uncharacterized protein n=1 Tax=Myceligenerans xiligouense TaxID=253184 RepID=A0A3N4YPB5_9MICO|nr:hypothetical protein [Myceligenerans xiligouense]RPF21306.1 hypothetical protein EDD34_1931 [Myceligenerans xiligouense]
MFDDDLERALERAYGADEHAKAAVRADVVAMHDHDTLDAGSVHGLIARNLWDALRSLGVSGGRMLVLGQDAELFAGLPVEQRRLRAGDHGGFTAPIPAATMSRAGMAPHPDLRLRAWHSGQDEGRYDVVVAVPGYTDVVLHRAKAATERRAEQILGLIGCLANTEPGGYTAGLVSRDVLDDADVDSRRLLTEFGDLVGALRLPSGALRDNPGTDSVVDLMILRRHDGTPLQPHPFLAAPVQDLRGEQVRVNQYFLDHPNHVLGRLSARTSPWGPPEPVVHATSLGLDRDLTAGLAAITSFARDAGLTATTQQPPSLDAPIDATLVHRSDLNAVRRRIQSLRDAATGPANEHPPTQPHEGPPAPPEGPDPRSPRRDDGTGPHL